MTENSSLIIRRARPEDYEAIRLINRTAFERREEADLVDDLRKAGAASLELVAEEDGRPVGHILFSPMTIETKAGPRPAIGLAPLAVLPEHQRTGVGSRITREGLEILAREGHAIVIVLGHPDYYPRFGFVPASRFGLRCNYTDAPDEAFMAMELTPGALAGAEGIARYHHAFDRF